MAQWSSLFLRTSDSSGAAAALQAALTHAGYTLYDPFGLMPGRAYPQAVKAFTALPDGAWTRIITADLPDGQIIAALSQLALTLSLALDGDQASVEVYRQGENVETVEALTPVLRAGKTRDDLRTALQQSGGSDHTASPFDVLSGEVKTMASSVNMKQAERLFTKMSGKLLNREQQSAANQMLTGQTPQWDSTGGIRIRAFINCLTPSNWIQPDFVALRDAYQLHNRKRRNPNAMLYPGDAEVMAAVPDALTYTPVFAGKS